MDKLGRVPYCHWGSIEFCLHQFLDNVLQWRWLLVASLSQARSLATSNALACSNGLFRMLTSNSVVVPFVERDSGVWTCHSTLLFSGVPSTSAGSPKYRLSWSMACCASSLHTRMSMSLGGTSRWASRKHPPKAEQRGRPASAICCRYVKAPDDDFNVGLISGWRGQLKAYVKLLIG